MARTLGTSRLSKQWIIEPPFSNESFRACGDEPAMAATMIWPAGRLITFSKASPEVSRYVQISQRSFLSSKPKPSETLKPIAAAAAKEAGGDTTTTVWTSRAGWACVKNCGACCILDKGPDYPPIEEVLTDPTEASLYRSMVGPDGWCVNYDKRSRSCKIHADRPRFCRVEPEIFTALYGIEEKDFAKEACGFCQDQIRSVYGGRSKELKTFQRVVRNLKKISS